VHPSPGYLRNLVFWQKFLLAILAGFLEIIIFPKIDLSWMAWVCAVPLLIACYREVRSGRAFFWGFTAGFIFFVGVCYWIAPVLRNYGDLSWIGASALFLLLVAYLSLFYGSFALLFAKLSFRFPTCSLYLSPFLWTTAEYLRAHFLTGFPWCLLGYSLVDCSNLVQLSRVTGVYGISFVIILINGLVAHLLLTWTKSALFRLAAASLILGGMSLVFSIRTGPLPPGRQQVRIVQTHISPEQGWSQESRSALLSELAGLSGKPDDHHTVTNTDPFRILLWPETPAPFYFNNDLKFRRWMEDLAKTSKAYLLFGFVDLRSSEALNNGRDPYNSVALLSPEGNFISQYDKIHLVPFGEYVPYASVFFFVDKISSEAGNFRSGEGAVVSPLGTNHALGAFVCYESILPELVRRFASQGAQVLVNVTNDGWFGDSSAPYQHLNMARFRAIENHRYLLRAANSGISAVIDPNGQIQTRSSLNERMALDSVFEWESDRTFYTRYGDVFAWSCLGVNVLAVGWMIWSQIGRLPRAAGET
jgi:apolipoprotein N-acyltransferase